MALHLTLALDRHAVHAGDELGATVEAFNASTTPLRIASASIELTGTETVDAARVAASYAAGRPRPTRPPGGGRGDARPLLAVPAAPLIDAADVLEPGERRVWRVAAALPRAAPPTVAGAAVRVAYRLTAAARTAPARSSADGGGTAGPWADAGARAALTVWPPRPRVRPPPGALAAGPDAAPDVASYEPGHVVEGGALSVVEVAPCAAGAAVAAAAAAAAAAAPGLALSPVQRRATTDDGGGSSMPASRRTTADGEGATADAGPPPAPPPPPPRSHHPTYVLRGAAGVELARLTLVGPPDGWLVPGATLRGALDLRGAASAAPSAPSPFPAPPPATPPPRAVRYAVSLECVETVAPKWAPPAGGGGGGGAGAAVARGVARRAVVDEWRDETFHLLVSDFALTVPPGASPSLATPLVSVGWVLRLELAASAGGGGAHGAPSPPPPPLLEWELPVAVYVPEE